MLFKNSVPNSSDYGGGVGWGWGKQVLSARGGTKKKKEGRRKEREGEREKKKSQIVHFFLCFSCFFPFPLVLPRPDFSAPRPHILTLLDERQHTAHGPSTAMDAADLSAIVRDFLSAFVTEVLAVRGLYSPDLFDRRRVLGFVAARRARHPGLAAYIDSAVGGMVVRGGKREREKERGRGANAFSREGI